MLFSHCSFRLKNFFNVFQQTVVRVYCILSLYFVQLESAAVKIIIFLRTKLEYLQ